MSHAYINYSYIKSCALPAVRFYHIVPYSFQDLDGTINCFFLCDPLQWYCKKEHDTEIISRVSKKDPFFVCVPKKTVTHSRDFGEVILTFCVSDSHPITTHN